MRIARGSISAFIRPPILGVTALMAVLAYGPTAFSQDGGAPGSPEPLPVPAEGDAAPPPAEPAPDEPIDPDANPKPAAEPGVDAVPAPKPNAKPVPPDDGSKPLGLPWSVDDIKKAAKPGEKHLYKSVRPKIEGSAEDAPEATDRVEWLSLTWKSVTDTGYVSEALTVDEKGEPLAGFEPDVVEGKWEDYTKHYDFTDKNTVVSDAKIKVGAGEFDCKLYTLTQKDDIDGTTLVLKFWFIKDKPGAWAKLEVTESGTVYLTNELESIK